MKETKKIKQKTVKEKLTRAQVLFGLILVLGLVLTGIQGMEYWNQRKAINETNSNLIAIQRSANKALTEFNEFSQSIDKNRFNEKEALAVVFPLEENYTGLTKEIEKYILALNSPDSPIFLSSLRFGVPAKAKDSEDFQELPFTMNISASEENFKKVLEYIYMSGDLNTKVRLMDLQSVSFNFDSSSNESQLSNKLVNATLNVKAYFKSPKTK